MRKEFALIHNNIEAVLSDNWTMEEDIVLKTQDAKEIFKALEDIEDADEYCIEEYDVDEDGEFVSGSDFDAVENFQTRYGTWYAVLKDSDDNDWGTGSFSLNEAQKMVDEYKANGFADAYIAVIDNRTDPVCVREIR